MQKLTSKNIFECTWHMITCFCWSIYQWLALQPSTQFFLYCNHLQCYWCCCEHDNWIRGNVESNAYANICRIWMQGKEVYMVSVLRWSLQSVPATPCTCVLRTIECADFWIQNLCIARFFRILMTHISKAHMWDWAKLFRSILTSRATTHGYVSRYTFWIGHNLNCVVGMFIPRPRLHRRTFCNACHLAWPLSLVVFIHRLSWCQINGFVFMTCSQFAGIGSKRKLFNEHEGV